MTRFFLAGIIQGSIRESRIHRQDYRRRIRDVIAGAVDDAEVYFPIQHHPNSLAYETDVARSVFFDLMAKAAQTDVLIAFLPEASMGTAIEMWQAHNAGRLVLAVSELSENWVVRFLADRAFPNVDELETFLRSDALRDLLRDRKRALEPSPTNDA